MAILQKYSFKKKITQSSVYFILFLILRFSFFVFLNSVMRVTIFTRMVSATQSACGFLSLLNYIYITTYAEQYFSLLPVRGQYNIR